MAIQVTDEILTIVATNPVIVEAGKEALRAVNARAAAAALAAGKASPGEEASGEEAAAAEASGEEADDKSTTATVIRGDLPAAAGLADVWLELRKTLNTIADPTARARRVVIARKPPAGSESTEPTEGEASRTSQTSRRPPLHEISGMSRRGAGRRASARHAGYRADDGEPGGLCEVCPRQILSTVVSNV